VAFCSLHEFQDPRDASHAQNPDEGRVDGIAVEHVVDEEPDERHDHNEEVKLVPRIGKVAGDPVDGELEGGLQLGLGLGLG
jgi:hypothetical protein